MKSGSRIVKGGKLSEASAPSGGNRQQQGKAAGAKGLPASYEAQLSEDRAGKVSPHEPGSEPVGALSSANSVSADPFAREKAMAAPVPQVTRHI